MLDPDAAAAEGLREQLKGLGFELDDFETNRAFDFLWLEGKMMKYLRSN